jgi:hypothetical protein
LAVRSKSQNSSRTRRTHSNPNLPVTEISINGNEFEAVLRDSLRNLHHRTQPLQFKLQFKEFERSQFEEERRREVEARSNQFEEGEDQNTDLFSVSILIERTRGLFKDLCSNLQTKTR